MLYLFYRTLSLAGEIKTAATKHQAYINPYGIRSVTLLTQPVLKCFDAHKSCYVKTLRIKPVTSKSRSNSYQSPGVTRLSLERWGSNIGPVKSNTVLPTDRHHSDISWKGTVLPGAMTQRWAPQTRYLLRLNTASKTIASISAFTFFRVVCKLA